MKKRTLYLIIGILVFMNILILNKLNQLNNRIGNLQHTHMDIINRIDGIYSNIHSMLKKEASIIDSYNIELGNLNTDDYTVPIKVTISPKEYTDDLTASLHINDDSTEMNKNGTTFSATANAYIFDDEVQVSIGLKHGDIIKSETIEKLYNLKSKYILGIYGHFDGESTSRPTGYSYKGNIEFDFEDSKGNSPVEISIVEELNGNIVREEPVKVSNNLSVSIPVDREIKLKQKDKFLAYANVKDRYGLIYKYIIMSLYVEDTENGVPIIDRYQDINGIVQISDKNGNILWKLQEDK